MTTVNYHWGCANIGLVSGYPKCGERFEESFGISQNGYPIVGYYESCTCCGDLCNNSTMDNDCYLPPVFTKECYGQSVTSETPVIDMAEAVKIKCTATQFCHVRYIWLAFWPDFR